MSVEHLFVDTNILVYAHDADAGQRHHQALDLVKSLWDRPYPAAISSQVLQELVAALFKKGATRSQCAKIARIYLDWEVVAQTANLTSAALDIWERFQTSWWDALIISAAQQAHASVLWSEDLQDGQRFDSLRIVNPFKGESS